MSDFYSQFIRKSLSESKVLPKNCLSIDLVNELSALVYDSSFSEKYLEVYFDRISNTLPFISKYRSGHINFIEEDIRILAEVIKSIILTLRNIDSLSRMESLLKVLCTFLIIFYIQSNFNIWQELDLEIPCKNELIRWISDSFIPGNLLSSFSIETDLFESKIYKQYQEGLNEKNFSKIYAFLELYLINYPAKSHALIEESVRFLYWADKDRLVYILDKQEDLISIYYLLRGLSTSDKLIVCSRSRNILVIVECVHEFNRSLDSKLNPSESKILVEIIVWISRYSQQSWYSFLKLFNSYPDRYKKLQIYLGEALAQMRQPMLQVYIDTLELTFYGYSSESIETCITSFLANTSNNENTRFMLHALFEKWNNFIERGLQEKCKASDLFCTEAFNIIVFYLSNFFDEEDMVNHINNITKAISRINSVWFSSRFLQISYCYILLSKLLIFSFAWKQCGFSLDQHLSLNRRLRDIFMNEYFWKSILLDSNKSSVSSEIEIIKSNLSLQINEVETAL